MTAPSSDAPGRLGVTVRRGSPGRRAAYVTLAGREYYLTRPVSAPLLLLLYRVRQVRRYYPEAEQRRRLILLYDVLMPGGGTADLARRLIREERDEHGLSVEHLRAGLDAVLRLWLEPVRPRPGSGARHSRGYRHRPPWSP